MWVNLCMPRGLVLREEGGEELSRIWEPEVSMCH